MKKITTIETCFCVIISPEPRALRPATGEINYGFYATTENDKTIRGGQAGAVAGRIFI